MKARVKATGEVFDIECVSLKLNGKVRSTFGLDEVKVLMPDLTPDYWTRLEHQYAGMAMQGILAHGENYGNSRKDVCNKITDYAKDCATALVEKLKEKEERK